MNNYEQARRDLGNICDRRPCAFFKEFGGSMNFLMGLQHFVERGPSTIRSALVLKT